MYRSKLERYFGCILTTRRNESSDAADEEILHHKSHVPGLNRNKERKIDIVLLSKCGRSVVFKHLL